MTTRIITPDLFTEAEALVIKELKHLGYPLNESLGYHTHFSLNGQSAISHINNPTSLYVRTLADFVSICPIDKTVWQIEVKDARDETYPNISMEAFPLLLHRVLWWLFDIKCLYVFVLETGIKACECQSLPVFKVHIPPKVASLPQSQWKKLFTQYYPGVPIDTKLTGGSHDPFGLIKRNEAGRMLYLSTFLRDKVEDKR